MTLLTILTEIFMLPAISSFNTSANNAGVSPAQGFVFFQGLRFHADGNHGGGFPFPQFPGLGRELCQGFRGAGGTCGILYIAV
jgi:hypothetical protein